MFIRGAFAFKLILELHDQVLIHIKNEPIRMRPYSLQLP